MSGFMTLNNEHLIRSSLWSNDLKEILEAPLMGTMGVRMIGDFPDGDTLNIPSIGQAEVNDYSEGNAVKYTGMDTGNYQFTIDQYKSSATYITNKMKQDSYVMNEIVSGFVPKQARALAASWETYVWSRANAGQTASDPNTINGARHRFVGGGTSPANDIIELKDFAKAAYALDMAYVPQAGRVAIVHPSCEFTLKTLTNIVNVSNNPQWTGVINTGLANGARFFASIYGFDVYISHFLPSGISETVSGNAVTNGVANYFFSTAVDGGPMVGHIRQAPKVESEYNKDLQREEYVTTMRYGAKLFRPENLVVCLTDTSQVYA